MKKIPICFYFGEFFVLQHYENKHSINKVNCHWRKILLLLNKKGWKEEPTSECHRFKDGRRSPQYLWSVLLTQRQPFNEHTEGFSFSLKGECCKAFFFAGCRKMFRYSPWTVSTRYLVPFLWANTFFTPQLHHRLLIEGFLYTHFPEMSIYRNLTVDV